MDRPTKTKYYLDIAKVVSERSPCLKMKVGAIIVKDDCILSTGYNGPPRGEQHCKVCSRLNIEHGESYSKECPSVHAEENAIINAARYGIPIKGAVLYLYTGSGIKPCYRCERAMKNAGIIGVVNK